MPAWTVLLRDVIWQAPIIALSPFAKRAAAELRSLRHDALIRNDTLKSSSHSTPQEMGGAGDATGTVEQATKIPARQ